MIPMTTDEFIFILIVDGVVALITIALAIKYLKDYEDDRKGRK